MATALTPVGAADRTQERALNPPPLSSAIVRRERFARNYQDLRVSRRVGQTNLTQLTCSLNVSDT
jgi:hypothetical protein